MSRKVVGKLRMFLWRMGHTDDPGFVFWPEDECGRLLLWHGYADKTRFLIEDERGLTKPSRKTGSRRRRVVLDGGVGYLIAAGLHADRAAGEGFAPLIDYVQETFPELSDLIGRNWIGSPEDAG